MSYKVVISGGGTGGHIFPAISIANEIKSQYPDADILFIGANGKMEMERVPAAGYKILGLPITGFPRKISIKIFKFVRNYFKSKNLAIKILKDFNPDFVVGVGGFASYPALYAAKKLNIPYFIQEQNSFPGKANKKLADNAQKIFVAYDNMERFFPKDKIIITGNPIRKDITTIISKSNEAYNYFNIDINKKTLLILGGSLGSRTINESIVQNLNSFQSKNMQILWQTGRFYEKEMRERCDNYFKENNIENDFIQVLPFIEKMNYAYSVADVIVSRAGASSISELSIVAKPVIFVPSPNVAEDHQTKNALALSEKDAAMTIYDKDSVASLVPAVIELIDDEEKSKLLSINIKKFARPEATKDIVKEIIDLF